MTRLLGWLWRWSFVPGLLFVAATGVFLARTLDWFVTFGIERDIEPFGVRLGESGRDELARLWRRTRLRLDGAGAPPAGVPELREVRLSVPDAGLSRLDADLPYSGLDSVDAFLEHDGRVQRIQLRYRGDTFVHWGLAKKSFRIRTKKSEPFLGMRTFNLIAPKNHEQLNNYLSYRLAHLLGLLTPQVELVRLRLNGEYHGLYLLAEQLSERTLRANDRMPGPIWAGELLKLGAWTGVPNELFERATLWDEIGAGDQGPDRRRAPLAALLAVLNEPADEASARRLGELMDLDKLARLSVLEQLTQSYHNDHFHNWRLYWDPWRRTFEPIVWDPVGWLESTRPPDGAPLEAHPVFSALHARLFGLVGFLSARDKVLRAFYDDGLDGALLAELDRTIAAVRTPLAADPNRRPVADAELDGAIERFAAFVRHTLVEARRAGLAGADRLRWRRPAGPGEPLLLELTTARPIAALTLRFAGAVEPARVSLRTPRPEGATDIDLGERWRAQGDTVVLAVQLTAELERRFRFREGTSPIRNHGLTVRPTSFELLVDGVDLRELAAVQGDGGREFAEDPELRAAPVRDLYHGIAPALAEPLTFAGEVVIEGVRDIRQPVRVAAGTTFRLGPGACLLLRSRLIAEGDADRPIRFVPAAAGQAPWGTIALEGAGCDGSRLSWCELRGGSGHRDGLLEYSAMLSVHGVDNLSIVDCELTDGRRKTDLVHLVYSAATLDRVRLDRAPADGIDCDVSRVVVRDCRFGACGDDGLDLMTTRALVQDCEFDRQADKGISVGERSLLVAIRNRVRRCATGIEVRESAIAALLHVDVSDCRTGVAADDGDWRYDGGGQVSAHRSAFNRNARLATAGGRSSVALDDCLVDVLPGPTPGVALRSCDGGPRSRSAPIPFPDALRPVPGAAGALWLGACSDLRGTGSSGEPK